MQTLLATYKRNQMQPVIVVLLLVLTPLGYIVNIECRQLRVSLQRIDQENFGANFAQISENSHENNWPPKTISKKSAIELLENNSNLNWIGEISLGQPEQNFKVLFDSGSADLWIPSKVCQTNACLSHRQFDANLSSTFEQFDYKRIAEVHYGDGEQISGYTASERLRVANLSINYQTIILATKVIGNDLERAKFDGIFGLGFAALSSSKRDTPLESLIKQQLISEPMFSIHLSTDLSRPTGGELLFGSIDEQYFTGEIVYAPLIEARYWQISLDKISLRRDNNNSDKLNTATTTTTGSQNATQKLDQQRPDASVLAEVCAPQISDLFGTIKCSAIVDTGTTLISGHRRQVQLLNDRLGAKRTRKGVYKLAHCDLSGLPQLVVHIGGHGLALEPEQYTLTYEHPDGSRACYSGIKEHSDDDYPFWILGDLFLAAYYTIFDHGQRRLGFARSRDTTGR